MRVYRTKGGYFYKELKNGKKTRISKEQYQKHRKKQKGKGIFFGNHQCRICRKRTPNEDFAEDVSEYCDDGPLVSKLLHYVPKDVIDESHLSYKSGTCRICKKCKQILDFTNDNFTKFEQYKDSLTCTAPANTKIHHLEYNGYYVPKSACQNGIVKTTKIESTSQSHGYTMDNNEVFGPVYKNINCRKCYGSSIDQSLLKDKIRELPNYKVVYNNSF